MPSVIPPATETIESLISENEIKQAVIRGARNYFDECRANIPGFVDRHFRYPGAIATNRVALGWDMARAPLNLLWAPFYTVISIVRYLLPRSGPLQKYYVFIAGVPTGFTTQVQHQITNLVKREIFQYDQQEKSLGDFIVRSLEEIFQNRTKEEVDHQRFEKLIAPILDDAIDQYQVTRTAAADIGNALSCTVLGAFAFKKFTPGGIGVALVLASTLATDIAARDFFLGETLGRLYYSWFPPQPSFASSAGSILLVMALLAAVAALSGMVTDPIQARTCLHQRRLRKMLDHLEQDFINRTRSGFRPKDQFIARILDAFDIIRSGLV